MSELNEHRVFGPPGTGKTTWMAKVVRSTAESRKTSRLIIGSFTRTAAAEIAGRGLPVDDSQIGTLHALAYRAIGRPPVAGREEIGEWNRLYPHFELSSGVGSLDEAVETRPGSTEGDVLLNTCETLRAKMVPFELWPDVNAQRFYKAWCQWKQDAGVIDFTDMIEIAVRDAPVAPGEPVVGFFDEVQDFTPLELKLVRLWGEKMDSLVLAGDDDQAQPAASRVLTVNGWKPLGMLDSTRDKLVSFDLANNRVAGGGFSFRRERHFENRLGVVVWVGGQQTVCTKEHRWWVKWVPPQDLWAVSLLSQNGVWQVKRHLLSEFPGDVATDSVFVLQTGSRWGTLWLKKRFETKLWGVSRGRLTERMLNSRVLEVLAACGRMFAHPFWRRGDVWGGPSGGVVQVRACNLLDEAHYVPVVDGSNVDWVPVWTFPTQERLGYVYSLAVEPHRTYITDGGIVTSNCIYSFKGASPDAFLVPVLGEENKRVLSQSWRVPREVHRVAQAWVERLSVREPKHYEPRDADGLVVESDLRYVNSVGVVDAVVDTLNRPVVNDDGSQRDRTVMLLASCSYMLDKIKMGLREAGVPFHNPYRKTRGDWNPLSGRGVTGADRLFAYLRSDERVFGDDARLWTGEDVKRWSSVVSKQGLFRRGLDGALNAMSLELEVPYEVLLGLFVCDETELEQVLEPSLDWFDTKILGSQRKRMEFPLAVARRDPRLLVAEPRVVIGTIHSVKGGEADTVFLFPDLSQAAMMEWEGSPVQRDNVVRLMYVGLTRAREELFICEPSTRFAVPQFELLAGGASRVGA